MAEKTEIGWTDSTWSPLRARVRTDARAVAEAKGYTSLVQIATKMVGRVGHHCEMVSKECINCYSQTNNARCLPHNGTGLPFDRRSRDLVEPFVDEKILLQPLSWRKPRKIFVESQSDLFGEWVTDEMIERVFAVMALCPQHTFQVLTKRAKRMRKWFTYEQPLSSREDFVQSQAAHTGQIVWDSRGSDRASYYGCGRIGDISNRRVWPGWPLPNVHLGVSAGTQAAWYERTVDLHATPAVVRFVSLEPLLEGIECGRNLQGIDWAIIGGESGAGARPCRVEWIESLIAQCDLSGVACFVKQLGTNPIWAGAKVAPIEPARGKCDKPEEWPESLRVQQFSRRLL